MSTLTHVDERGQARMVDVSNKPPTVRLARARGRVLMRPATAALIAGGGVAKGDVLGVARIAGIMGAKRVGELIPLCHPIAVTSVQVELEVREDEGAVEIEASVQTVGPTGVEMEALTAVSVAALTIYDMCKAADKDMVITDIRLVEKSGGRSGHYLRADEAKVEPRVEQPAAEAIRPKGLPAPPVVSVVGYSGSGKTTLLEKLIAELVGRGYRVGVVKHDAHDFEMDHEGKDTWRLSRAGAEAVAISSPHKCAVIRKTVSEMGIAEVIALLPRVDVILTEGYKTGDKPKIVVCRSERGTVPCMGDSTVIAYASDFPVDTQAPVYDINDASGLANLLEDRWLRKP